MDRREGWAAFLSTLDPAWWMLHGVSVWFKAWRFAKKGDVACLPDVDMAVFSFASTTFMDKGIWSQLLQHYRFTLVLNGMKT